MPSTFWMTAQETEEELKRREIPPVWERRRYSSIDAKQRDYFETLMCTTYDLCCHKHKDMVHAENCPILAAEMELVKAEIEAIESDATGMVLQQYIQAGKLKANDRKFWLGMPCWMR